MNDEFRTLTIEYKARHLYNIFFERGSIFKFYIIVSFNMTMLMSENSN